MSNSKLNKKCSLFYTFSLGNGFRIENKAENDDPKKMFIILTSTNK